MEGEPENAPITVIDLENLIGELRGLARGMLRSEKGAHTLTPTALALTALRRAKLSDQEWDHVRWENRAHFFKSLMTAMRHALIDRARYMRAKGREKAISVPWDDRVLLNLPAEADERPDRFIALDEALEQLRGKEPRLTEVIQMFYFAGYTTGEVARFLDVAEKTVDRDLAKARVILKRSMEKLRQTA